MGLMGSGAWDLRFESRDEVFGALVLNSLASDALGICERLLCEDWALSEVLPSTAYLVHTQGVS